MKKLQELKEIAENHQEYINNYSFEEQALIYYFRGDSSPLIQMFQDYDPEQTLFIIKELLKSQEIGAETDLHNYIFDDSKAQELLSQRSIPNFLTEEDISKFSEFDIKNIPVALSIKNSVLGFSKIEHESKVTSAFKNRLNKVKEKSKTNPNLRKNIAMVAIAAMGMMSSACGKNLIPTAKANYGTQPTPIVFPITEISGDMPINFANNAVMPDEDNLLSSYFLNDQVLLKVPGIIEKINYQEDAYHPTLTLTANGEYVCSYIWVKAGETNPNALDPAVATKGNYRMHKSCFQEIQGDKGMVLMMVNIPKAKTVSMKFHYEK